MRVDRDQLLSTIDLTALLDELAGPPARLGRNARWHCVHPGHDDVHPSVTVFADRRGIQHWKCWSGGHGGTAIDALTIATGCTIRDAIDNLATRTGTARVDHQAVCRGAIDVPLHPCVSRYVDACANIIWTRTGRPVLDWLHERGFDDDVLRANRVGCDPGPKLLRRPSGLPRGGLAAVFPALDRNGNLTYAQARYVELDQGHKYDNPAHALATNPRLAWPVCRAGTTVPPTLVVCEGIPDALTAAAGGLASVAVLGTGTVDHRVACSILDHARDSGRRLIVVAFDADKPGDDAAQLLVNHLGGSLTTVRLRPPAPMGDLNAWAIAEPDWSRALTQRRGPMRPMGVADETLTGPCLSAPTPGPMA